jgi:hypothetical protein
MGLDVYFKKTTVQFHGDPSNIQDFENFCEEASEAARGNLRAKLEKMLKPLREAWDALQTNDYWRNIYNERYFAFVEQLRPLIAKNYDWKIYPYTKEILDFPELEKQVEEEVKDYYLQYDAYFRKVNFIFAYYQNNGKMVDEYYAFTDKDDIDDIISRCERVLADHSLANELLPTQSGFFFGGTDYNDWYFDDVKDCLQQMKKYRKLLTDGVTGFVIFSW